MGKREGGAVSLIQGSALKAILYFSIPLFIGNIFQQLYNVIDSVIVGNYVGADALAAVGVCFPVIFTMFSLFFGIGTGTSVVVSCFCGAGNAKKVEKTIKTVYTLILVGSVPLALIGGLWGRQILSLIHVPADILGPASDYLRIYSLASIANLGFNINDGILRGLGNSKASLVFLTIACLSNVVMDLVFVLTFRWAVAGVAVATAIAQMISWVGSLLYIRKHYMVSGAFFSGWKPDWEIFKRICRIGIPTGIQHAIFSLGTVVMQTIINSFGSAFIAGFNAASKVDMFAFMPIQSFTSAATVFVGQNLGAKKLDRIRKGIFSTLKMSLLVDGAIVSLIFCFAPQLLGIFNRDPQVIQAGLDYLYRILPFYLIYTVTSMMHAVLRGLGVTAVPTLIMIAALWLGRVPAAYLLSLFFGRGNVFFCYGVGWVIEIILLSLYYRSGRWKKAFWTKEEGES